MDDILEYIKKEWVRLLIYTAILLVAAWVATGPVFSEGDYSVSLNDPRVTTLFVGDNNVPPENAAEQAVQGTKPQIPDGEQIMATSTLAVTDAAGSVVTKEDGTAQTMLVEYITNGETIVVTDAQIPPEETEPSVVVTTTTKESTAVSKKSSSSKATTTTKKSTTTSKTTTKTTTQKTTTSKETQTAKPTDTVTSIQGMGSRTKTTTTKVSTDNTPVQASEIVTRSSNRVTYTRMTKETEEPPQIPD